MMAGEKTPQMFLNPKNMKQATVCITCQFSELGPKLILEVFCGKPPNRISLRVFFFNLALFIAWRLARNPRFSHRSVLSVHKGRKNIVQINQTSESKIFTTYYRPPHNPIYQLAFIPTFLTYLIFIGIARSI